jgi:hypothetical protein
LSPHCTCRCASPLGLRRETRTGGLIVLPVQVRAGPGGPGELLAVRPVDSGRQARPSPSESPSTPGRSPCGLSLSVLARSAVEIAHPCSAGLISHFDHILISRRFDFTACSRGQVWCQQPSQVIPAPIEHASKRLQRSLPVSIRPGIEPRLPLRKGTGAAPALSSGRCPLLLGLNGTGRSPRGLSGWHVRVL